MDETDRERIIRLETQGASTHALLQNMDKKLDIIAASDSKQDVEITGLKKDMTWMKRIGKIALTGSLGGGALTGIWTWIRS